MTVGMGYTISPSGMSTDELPLWLESHQSLEGAGIYADWLEERGRVDDSHCWRWIHCRKKEPVKRETYLRGRGYKVPNRWSWGWFSETLTWDSALKDIPLHARIPDTVMFQLRSKGYAYFESKHTAIEALRLQLLRVLRLMKCNPEEWPVTLMGKPVVFVDKIDPKLPKEIILGKIS